MEVLGIHSSPIEGGNTAFVLDAALAEAAAAGATTVALSLRGLAIADCNHCNACMARQAPRRLCAIEDDATPILERILACDVLVLASPVYFGRISGTLACLLDRTRCFLYGRAHRMALAGKVGVALAVGWHRNFGIETTLAGMSAAFLMHGMRVATCHDAGALYGAGVVSGRRDDDPDRRRERLGARDDREGLESARRLVREALRMAAASRDGAL